MTTFHRSSLRYDTAWAMAGALAQTVGQAAIMLALTQVASTQIVGQYALGLAIAAPLNVFADRAIRMLQATAGENDFPLGDYLALRCLVGLGALVVTLCLIVTWRLEGWTAAIVLLVALGRFVEGIAQTLYGRLQRDHQMPQIGQSQVLRGLLSATVSVTCLWVWRRLDFALTANVVANVIVLIALDHHRVRRSLTIEHPGAARTGLGVSWRHAAWGKMIRLALPLAISTFFVSLSVNLPRLFLSWTASESILGVFAVLCYLCFPATMLVSAIMQAATPRLASSYRDDPGGRYRQLSRRLMVACASVAVISWWAIHWFGRSLLNGALGTEYVVASGQLDWISAASGIGYLAAVPATAMNAQRLFRLSAVTCGISCAVTCLAGWTLIPRYEMTGAAATLMLTSGTHLLVSIVALRHFLDSQVVASLGLTAVGEGRTAA